LYPEAVRHYRAAIDLDPCDAGWHGEMARALLLRLDLEGTAAYLGRAMEAGASMHRRRGLSRNRSQHLIGQLLDEFALDQEVVDAVRPIMALPAAEQVVALTGVVRRHPDSTVAAVMFLLAMRRSGRFDVKPDQSHPAGATRIPRQIVQFWDAETPPPEVEALMRSWRRAGDGFEHIAFNDRSAEAFILQHASSDVLRAFRRASHATQRSDIFRLAYLASNGGIYADADDRFVSSIDALAPAGATLVAYQENYGTIANNLLSAEPKHPVIIRALALATESINRGDRDIVWLSTGPGLMSRAFAQVAAETDQLAWLASTKIREYWELPLFVAIHCPARYKRTSRHWSGKDSVASATGAPRQPPPAIGRRGGMPRSPGPAARL
jgi:hypothetical protein